nr:unnamed protein product [Callosobruchus chinensis]
MFYTLLDRANAFLLCDIDLKEFGGYFIQNYEKNSESWAYCFRMDSGINTNMHLERMHRTIKQIYCNDKKVKRLDSVLNILQRFVRDRLFYRLKTLHKGKLTSKMRDLRKRNKTEEHCQCHLQYNICNHCIHSFICSCIDNSV